MKKSLSIISMLGMFFLAGCGTTVVEYNDNLVAIVTECVDSADATWMSFKSDDAMDHMDTLVSALTDSIDVCEASVSKASKAGDFDGDTSLQEAVVDVLNTYVAYLQKFSETSMYWNIEDITEEDQESYNNYKDELSELESQLNTKSLLLQQAQTNFAESHGLELESL